MTGGGPIYGPCNIPGGFKYGACMSGGAAVVAIATGLPRIAGPLYSLMCPGATFVLTEKTIKKELTCIYSYI